MHLQKFKGDAKLLIHPTLLPIGFSTMISRGLPIHLSEWLNVYIIKSLVSSIMAKPQTPRYSSTKSSKLTHHPWEKRRLYALWVPLAGLWKCLWKCWTQEWMWLDWTFLMVTIKLTVNQFKTWEMLFYKDQAYNVLSCSIQRALK